MIVDFYWKYTSIFNYNPDQFQCDQQKEGIVNNPAKMEEYCKEHNFSGWFETSAKENINIDEAAKSLVTQVSMLMLSLPWDQLIKTHFYGLFSWHSNFLSHYLWDKNDQIYKNIYKNS